MTFFERVGRKVKEGDFSPLSRRNTERERKDRDNRLDSTRGVLLCQKQNSRKANEGVFFTAGYKRSQPFDIVIARHVRIIRRDHYERMLSRTGVYCSNLRRLWSFIEIK